MSPLAVGPILALVGIVAAFFVLRGRARTRKSMYRTLRERREVDLRRARERATAAKASVEKSAIEREAAAAAASAQPALPASSATIPAAPAEPAPPPPPPPGVQPPPAFTPQEPAFTPQQPAYSPPEPLAAPPPPPFEEAPYVPPPVEDVPVPPPAAGDQTRPAWEIVQPDKQEAEGGSMTAAGAAGKASWELDSGEQQRIDDRRKGRGRHEAGDEEEELGGEESLPQVLLSYAGLAAALLVILLGIFIMIGGRGPN